MNRLLLFAAALLIVTAANAQFKRSEALQTVPRPTLQHMDPEVKMEEIQMPTPGTPVFAAPKRDSNVNVWYRRPAGAFTSILAVMDGADAGTFYAPYLTVKPYSDYTFLGFADGVSENPQYYWEVQHYDLNNEQTWTTVEGKNLTWQWRIEADEVPKFNVIDNSGYYWWYLRGYEMGITHPNEPIEHRGILLSVPNTIDIWGYDILKSSKTFGYGHNQDQGQPSLMTVLSGPDPYGQNEKGWWFGKNGGKNNYCYDGIAQAFEKPEHPYLLNQVVMDCALLEVVGPVDMYCKIYKIDEIPPYMDDGVATLPEVPGELIAKGRASLTPETYEETRGLVFFTLYDDDEGLEYDITPTIDDAILVVVDGYNDPVMENLLDFSAMIASNYDEDEGFGELAYLKVGVPDEEGNLDHYEWRGLNNFFSNRPMKTGITIFLSTELPYLTFYVNDEDGEYTFPKEGGLMEKHFINHTSRSIEFWSWVPSEDDAWEITCNGGKIPDWLTIELEDLKSEGEFSGVVNAVVTAEPLPEEAEYREAIVRFGFPGAYIDYKFMQGVIIGPNPPPYHEFDYNHDGEINVADVNTLIDLILNNVGEYNIADLNALIDYIVNKNRPPY